MTRITVKAMKRALKKAGLKTTGKKAALTRRCKKAHLKLRGGDPDPPPASLRTPAQGVLPGPNPPPPEEPSTATSAVGFSNKTPAAAPAPASAPAGPPSVERMGGRHRRGHRGSRKSRSRKH